MIIEIQVTELFVEQEEILFFKATSLRKVKNNTNLIQIDKYRTLVTIKFEIL